MGVTMTMPGGHAILDRGALIRPKIQVALQKFAKLETISGLGVAKYSEAVDEAMALIEKYKPSMYPQAAVE